jgi:hypothetical protein
MTGDSVLPERGIRGFLGTVQKPDFRLSCGFSE